MAERQEFPDPESSVGAVQRAWLHVLVATSPLALGGILLLLGNIELVRGRNLPQWDAAHFYAPIQINLADHARAGRFVLWDPWINAGRPDCADPQVGAFSPFNVGIGWLTGGSLRGFVAYWLITWAIGGLGVFLLGRSLGSPAWGNCIAVLAFLSCGFYIGHGQHTSFIQSFSFLPLIVWRFEVALTEKSSMAAVQAGSLWGLSALGGYPGLTIATAFFLGLWTLPGLLDRSTTEQRAGRPVSLARRIGHVVVVWTLFLGVGLVVLVPTYLTFFSEGRSYSDRAGALSKERAVRENALDPQALLTMATPYAGVLKMHYPKRLWPETGISLSSCYIILPSLFLTITLLTWVREDRVAWWIFGIGLFLLLAAMGGSLPVRGWLYELVPPMRYFRHSAIFRGYFLFCFVVLTLLASRAIDRASEDRARRFWIHLGIVVAATLPISLWVVLSLLSDPGPKEGNGSTALWMVVGLNAALLGVATIGGLRGHLDFGVRRVLPWGLVLVAFFDALYSIRVSEGILGNNRPRLRMMWEETMGSHETDLDLTDHGLSRDRASWIVSGRSSVNLVTKEPALLAYDPLNSWFYRVWTADERFIEWVIGSERFWFSPQAAWVDLSRGGFSSFEATTKRFQAPVIAVHDREIPGTTPLEAVDPARRIPVQLIAYEPNRLDFVVEAPSKGWLWVTERYTEGWLAELNGQPVPVHLANFLFRAIQVEAGENHVEFIYRPFAYPWLVILSWGTLFVIVIAAILHQTARSQRRSSRRYIP